MEEYEKESKFGMKQKISDIETSSSSSNSNDDDDGGVSMLKKRPRKTFHYFPFKKDVYIEAKEIQDMTPEDVAAYRKQLQLDIIFGGGNDVPNPIKTWRQSGLPIILLETIRADLKYAKAPLPIQAQALPVIMSGRDCIAVANTGSGKILAFGLPMMAHLMAVRRQEANIALVVTPTVDLVYKIYTSLLKFISRAHVVCIPLYGAGRGGSADDDIFKMDPLLKFRAGIVIGTPDTIISAGEITRVLDRVTFLVMYQADRMLHMGFETKLISIASNTRHDRQNLVFSSTFNHASFRLLTRKVAYKPVEIHAHPMSPPQVEEVNQGVVYRPHDSCYEAQLEINDFPVKAIWKAINREALASFSERTGTTIIVKGEYIPVTPLPGERKLYLSIEGGTEQSALLAKAELHRLITSHASSLSSSRHGHHFSQVSELGSTHA